MKAAPGKRSNGASVRPVRVVTIASMKAAHANVHNPAAGMILDPNQSDATMKAAHGKALQLEHPAREAVPPLASMKAATGTRWNNPRTRQLLNYGRASMKAAPGRRCNLPSLNADIINNGPK